MGVQAIGSDCLGSNSHSTINLIMELKPFHLQKGDNNE